MNDNIKTYKSLKFDFKKWFNEDLNLWLDRNYSAEVKISDDNKICLTYKGIVKDFDISDDDIKELCNISQIKVTESIIDGSINYIYKTSDNSLLTLICNNNSISIDKRLKLNFINGDTELTAKINSALSYSLLFLLVSKNVKIKFKEYLTESEFNSIEDWFELFYCNTLEIEAKNNFDDNNLDVIVLSIIYNIILIFKIDIAPYDITNNELDKLYMFQSQIKQLESDESRPDKLPLILYEKDPLIYYFAAINNQDTRYKYFEYYHILEYYFERVLIERTLVHINEGFNDIENFYNKEKRISIANKIKSEFIISDKNLSLNEEQLLKSLLDSYLSSAEFDDFRKIVFDLKEITNPKIQKINLSEIKKDSAKLSSRIYSIRNSITHSKKNVLVPNSKEIKLLERDLHLIKNIADFLLKKFSESKK